MKTSSDNEGLITDLWRHVVIFLSPSDLQSFKKSSKMGLEVTANLLRGGQLVVAANNKAYIFDVEHCTLLHRLEICIEGHTCLFCKFSSDGRRIVTSTSDCFAKVFDTQTGTLLFTLRGHTSRVSQCAFSIDGSRIITGSNDTTARIFSGLTGLPKLCLHLGDVVRSVAFSTNCQRALIVSYSAVQIFSARTGAHELNLDRKQSSFVFCAVFSRDDKSIITSSYDRFARIWNANTGTVLKTLIGHTSLIRSCAFSPTDVYVATASDDATARIWDLQHGTEQRTLTHSAAVISCAFSEDGTRLATAAVSGIVRISDAYSGLLLSEFNFAHTTNSCDFTTVAAS